MFSIFVRVNEDFFGSSLSPVKDLTWVCPQLVAYTIIIHILGCVSL